MNETVLIISGMFIGCIVIYALVFCFWLAKEWVEEWNWRRRNREDLDEIIKEVYNDGGSEEK